MSAATHPEKWANFAKPIDGFNQVVLLKEDRIRVRREISSDETFFRGHYPDFPIFPGVFLVEVVLQAVRFYLLEFNLRAKLLELKAARFTSPVRPGDVLDCDCFCSTNSPGKSMSVNAVLSHDDIKVATVTLLYALAE